MGATVSAMLSRPQVLIVLALLVAAAAVVFFPDIKITERVADVPSAGTKSEPVAMAPLGQSSPTPVEEAPAPVTQTDALREVMSTPVAPSPTVATASQTAASPQSMAANPAANAPALAASAPAPARSASAPVIPTTGLVVFRARAASWVKVVDAKGVVQLSKTLAQGEVAGASGATPLSVVVGRVDMTDVEVRGQTYSMADVARENVARFEVK
jgi:cytoskeleton protein RodZ